MQKKNNLDEHFISIDKQARFYTAGNPTAKKCLFVLHGYGQLAYYFLQKFSHEALNDYFIVAPEGLHRFYLSGTAGRVGASWMTKELRLIDIEENNAYLNRLFKHISSERDFEKTSVLGFSQGGATASRWVQQADFKIDNFILWASVFPADVEPNLNNSPFNSCKKQFVLGNSDPYYSTEQQAEIKNYYSNFGFKIHTFMGEHTIEPNLFNTLFTDL